MKRHRQNSVGANKFLSEHKISLGFPVLLLPYLRYFLDEFEFFLAQWTGVLLLAPLQYAVVAK